MGNITMCKKPSQRTLNKNKLKNLIAKAAEKLEQYRGPLMLDSDNFNIYGENTLFFTHGLTALCIVHISKFLYVRFNIEVSNKESLSFKSEAQYIPVYIKVIATPYFVYENHADLLSVQEIIKQRKFCDEICNRLQRMKFVFTYRCANSNCKGTKTLKVKISQKQDECITDQICSCVDKKNKFVTKYPWASTAQERYVDIDQVMVVHASQFAFFDAIHCVESYYKDSKMCHDALEAINNTVYVLNVNEPYHAVRLTEKNIDKFCFFQWKSACIRTGKYDFMRKEKKFYKRLLEELEMALHEERTLQQENQHLQQEQHSKKFIVVCGANMPLTIITRHVSRYGILMLKCLQPIVPGTELPLDVLRAHAANLIGIEESEIRETKFFFSILVANTSQHREHTFV